MSESTFRGWTNPLERILACWEDYWRLMKVRYRLLAGAGQQPDFQDDGCMANAHKLREMLLSLYEDGAHPGLPIGSFRCPTGLDPQLQKLPMFPEMLAAWTLNSRRIYRLSAELEAVLGATSLDGVTWSDVEMPFLSFGIQLAQPFIDPDGRAFDFILIVKGKSIQANQEHDVLLLSFFGVERARYQPLRRQQLDQVQNLITRRQLTQAQQEILRLLEATNHVYESTLTLVGLAPGELVTETAKIGLTKTLSALGVNPKDAGAPDEAHMRTWDIMIRKIVGMALYLKTLPPNSPHLSEPRQPIRRGQRDRLAITSSAEVCDVSSVIPLTCEEKIYLRVEGAEAEQRAALRELSCHWREGHWRRPPGQGNNPETKRTVHVRPCIVRRDRLPDGAVPGGAVKE